MKPVLSKSISQVVARLDALPQVGNAVVFGSLLSNPSTAKDVDIAFLHDDAMSLDMLQRLLPVVQVGAYRTPRYGLLDVFVDFKDILMVRDEDSVGFVRAKKASDLRPAIHDNGVAWDQWRQSVDLHPEVAPAKPRPLTVYFAHPISDYCTTQEDRAIASLEAAGLVVVNPSDRIHQEACGSDMVKWATLAASCDSVAFSSFEDGAIGAGVVKEVDRVYSQGKPVYKISQNFQAIVPVRTWPGNFNLLSVDETRARINPFRDARKAQGLPPIPVRDPSPPAIKGPRP